LNQDSTTSAGSTGITLRSATPHDKDFLLSVYASTRAEELALTPWSDAERLAFVEMQFAAQHTDYERRFPTSDHSVVQVDGVSVGRIWIARGDDEIRLLDVALLPEHRNEGIGTFLLRRMQDEAAVAGKPLRHSVYKMNSAALRFYHRLGFRVVEDFETYVLMEWIPPD